MIFITILLIFLAGFAFSAWGVPLLEGFFNTIVVWFQKIQTKMAVDITEDSVSAAKIKQGINESALTSVVGFAIPNGVEEDYYESE